MNVLTKQCLTGAVAAAFAFAGGAIAQGGTYEVVSGGASYNEFDELMTRADDYSLKVIVASKRSGAYLADVDLQVVSLPRRETVLEHRTQGPLMLADLPPGRYEVRGTFADVLPGKPETVSRTVVVPREGLAQAVLYFETGD